MLSPELISRKVSSKDVRSTDTRVPAEEPTDFPRAGGTSGWTVSFPYTLGLPYWHFGLIIAYSVVPSKFTAGVYLYITWNSLYENNDSKTLGAQFNWLPLENLSIYYDFLNGPEQTNNNSDRKIIHDLSATWTANSWLALSTDLLFGLSSNESGVFGGPGDAGWSDWQLAAKFNLTRNSYLSSRLEVYRDAQAITSGAVQILDEITLTSGLIFGGRTGVET